MEKSRRVKSYQNQNKPFHSRLNQPRKSLSTSNILSNRKTENLYTLKSQISEPSYQPNSNSFEEGFPPYFHRFDLGSSNHRISFEETDQVFIPMLPRSPYMDQSVGNCSLTSKFEYVQQQQHGDILAANMEERIETCGSGGTVDCKENKGGKTEKKQKEK